MSVVRSPQAADAAHAVRSEIDLLLSARLRSVSERIDASLRTGSGLLSDVLEHLRKFQGKQLRPILSLLFQQMTGGDISESGCRLAASVEMIHLATLVHDDVIDDADQRRHVATVHRRWDTQTSVLLGDFLFSKAFRLAATTGDAEACELIGRATDRTCEGEFHQMASGMERSESVRDYLRIARGKTGQLFGLSCLLGARCGGAQEHLQRVARRFGLLLGMAFQIADDMLDLSGDVESTGKDTGNDLANGRLTLPVLLGLRSADAARRDELRRLLTGDSVQVSDLPELQAGVALAGRFARRLVENAVKSLQHFKSCRERDLLESLAFCAVQRSR